jgi:hypothetical protein
MSIDNIRMMKMFSNYQSPIYPLVVRERFDENMMKPLLTDENFARKDRDRLSAYNKRRLTGGAVPVSYRFGIGCEDMKVGRVYPEDGVGLQAFRSDLRSPLLAKDNWDVDMVNAHWNIANWMAKKLNLKNEKIDYLCKNRAEVLNIISADKKKSKTELLKCLYGGEIKMYKDYYNEVEGEMKMDGIVFLRELEKEVKVLMDMVWMNNEPLQTLKMGKEKKSVKSKPNPKASLMSLVFQSEERKILELIDFGMKQKDRRVNTYIHDGCAVEKLPNELAFPADILDELSREITEHTGIDVRLEVKPMAYNWTPPTKSLSQYQQKKAEFEKTTCLVGSVYYIQHPDGWMEPVKPSDMCIRQKNNWWMEYDAEKEKEAKKFFLPTWEEDVNRKDYQRMDFIPDVDACPDYIYNMFKGFEADKFRPLAELTEAEKKIAGDGLAKILQHMNYLTGGNLAFLNNYLGWIVQNPSKKCGISLLFRDEDGLLSKGGGTGKNLFFDELISKNIIGENYCVNVADNAELYGNFNSMFENKLFVFVEEASGKDNHQNADKMKANITRKRMVVKKKCVAEYDITDLANYIWATNNRNSIPIGLGNRRYAVFDVDASMRDNEKYFTELVEAINNPLVIWAFYQHLKAVKTYDSPIQFQNNIPLTPAYLEMRKLNAPSYLKWIISEVEDGVLEDGYVGDLFNRYRNWVKEWKEGKDDSCITLTAFGMKLNASAEANQDYYMEGQGEKSRLTKGMSFRWNKAGVISGLKKLSLISQDFVYKGYVPPPSNEGTDVETEEE